MKALTQKMLKEIFSYNGKDLIWKKTGIGISNGKVAGCVCSHSGYRRIKVNGSNYPAHRLVYIYHYGGDYHSGLQIDHINRKKSDNRIKNLRLVTNQENGFNRRGVKGYSWQKMHKKWGARIMLDGVDRYLGYFDSEEEAHAAYLNAKPAYHTIPKRDELAS